MVGTWRALLASTSSSICKFVVDGNEPFKYRSNSVPTLLLTLLIRTERCFRLRSHTPVHFKGRFDNDEIIDLQSSSCLCPARKQASSGGGSNFAFYLRRIVPYYRVTDNEIKIDNGKIIDDWDHLSTEVSFQALVLRSRNLEANGCL
jgi:hypothetical protein